DRHLGLLLDHRRAAAVRSRHPALQWRSQQFPPHHRDLPLPVRTPAHEARLRWSGQRHAVHRLRGHHRGPSPPAVFAAGRLLSDVTANRKRRRRPEISPFQWLTLALVAAFIIVPFYTTVLGGFKSIGELRTNPFGLPASWDPANFTGIIFGTALFRSLWN